MDPSIGMIKINKDKFYKEFTNIILYFVPTNQLPSLKNKRIVISTIHKYIKNYKLQIISVIILNISYVILSILSSTYSAFINHNLYIISTIFILFNICTSLTKYSINKKMNKLIYKIDNSLSKDIFNHILNLPLKYLQFKDKGEIIKRIEDAEVIKELELTYVIKTILNIMMILPLIILIGTQVKEIYSLTIILILLYIIVNKNYHKNINECIEKEIRDNTNYNNYLINMINGIASIYHASSNNYFIDNILKLKNNKNLSTYNLTNLMNKYELKNNIIIKSMEIILNIILLLKLQNNLLSITTVFIINILFAQLITSLLEVISFIPINRYKKRLVNKVDEFLNIENDTEETNYINKLDNTIKDLSFSYNS